MKRENQQLLGMALTVKKALMNIKVKSQYLEQYKNGYPLISQESIENLENIEEGTIVNLLDSSKKFIAKGYLGKQNKGFGWVLSNKKDENFDKKFFTVKIKSAIEYRKEFFLGTQTTAFRVFNGTGDGVGGLTIDYFDGYYLITWYSLGIYTFKGAIIEALQQSVEYKGIYQKRRFATNGQYLESEKDFVCGEVAPEPLIVKENDVNFAIYLDDGPMVGIFLDQKEVRKTLRDKYAKGKIVLNTFSYTGAFSVYAKLGGALKTISVDLANRSLPKTKEQFTINNINPESENIIVKDVFEYFKLAVKQKLLFDLVVVDPPSFARSKKNTFSVTKDYVKLLKEIIQITTKGGVIVASTNYANFNLAKFRDFIDKAFKESKSQYKIEQTFSLPKDFRVSDKFREDNYLKVVFIRKVK